MGIVGGFMVPHPPMIVPAVGQGSEAVVKETTMAYEKVAEMVAELKPDTIVISSPHTVLYADYFHISPGASASGSFAGFRAPEVSFSVDYDEEFVQKLSAFAAYEEIDAGILGEKDASLDHGTMVPLYFITKKYTDCRIVRLGLSGFSLETHYRMGMLVKRVAEELDRRVVYIASGDLSHKLKEEGPYGFDEAGPVYDERIMDVMGSGSFDQLFEFDEHFLEKAAECGHRSFVMLAGALDRTGVSIERLSHQDVTGVGYGICTYLVTGSDESRAFLDKWERTEDERRLKKKNAEDAYVRLARASLESYIKERKKIRMEDVCGTLFTPEEKEETEQLRNRRAGVFVSLHKQGQLRGCIGTIMATKDSIADEIIENAISASTRDPRFSPVTEEELKYLEYSVDVLGETEEIETEEELDVKRYGVIVTKGMKRGLLLPNLDGVDTVEEQLSIAKRKAGLLSNEKGCKLERFEVIRHY